MSEKKVILIAPAFPYRGGIAATTDRLALEYHSRGVDVEIWTFKLLYPKFIFPGKTQYLEDGHDSPKDIKIYRKISSINPFNWFKVGRQLKKSGAQQVVFRHWLPFFGPCFGTIARIASKNIKITCLVDNVIPHEKRMGDIPFTKYFFKRVKGFIVMAREGEKQLKETFKTKADVIYSPHPIFDIYGDPLNKDEACNTLKLDPNHKYILSFGLVRRYKGVDLLIEAFSSFQKDHPNHKLLIVGECYDDWNDYQTIIDKHDLNDKIVRVDKFVANDDVKYYFSAADYLALTYRSATQSGVTQIAYSMNLPMLVTNVGDLANMVKHDVVGQVCENNVDSITESLDKMSKESNLSAYQQNILEEKKLFSWKYLCDNLDKIA